MTPLPPWTPFQRAHIPKMGLLEGLDYVEDVAQAFDVQPEVARQVVDDIQRHDDVWMNSRYQVNIRRDRAVDGQEDGPRAGWPEMIHLSIKRRDKQPMGPERYRDFMLIKDELVGPEHEAVELYPRRSRETDTANQYHLWVLARSDISFPFGFREGRHVNDITSRSGARQAHFEEHHKQ
jgi:hypothetical protein